ncbi:MAG: hypothetical protein EBT45_04070 [Alphaproteobacteria bacterium]|nr:hypothetical protein [Alphaproteobacteria bacterium]
MAKLFYILVILFAFGRGYALEEKPKEGSVKEEIPVPQVEGLKYKIKWSSTLDPELLTALKAESTLIKLENRPPAARSGIIKRAQKDVIQFKKVLAAHGYFSGQIDFKLFENSKPIKVKLKVHPGIRYKIAELTLISSDNPELMAKQSIKITYDVIGIKPGDFVDLAKIHSSREKIKKYFQHIGYPFVEIQDPQAIINHETKELQIIYHLTTGFLAHIQDTKIEGLKRLSPQFLKNRVLWHSGQIYDQKLVDKTRRRLIETGLLSSVTITPEKASAQSQTSSKEEDVIMNIKTSESPPRSIGAGARYATSDGVGGNLSWSHSNLYGGGERLGASVKSSKREKVAKLGYDMPDFFSPQQKLMNEVALIHDRNRAYVGRTFNVGTRVQRPFNDAVGGSLGLLWEAGHIRRENVTYNTHLLGVPGELKIDGSNDLLNPTHGGRADFKVTPYIGKMSTSNGMTITQANLTGYLPFMSNELGESDGVLAGFVKGGSIFIKYHSTNV